MTLQGRFVLTTAGHAGIDLKLLQSLQKQVTLVAVCQESQNSLDEAEQVMRLQSS